MNAKQFYIVLWVFVLTSKIQKLPCLMYGYIGKDFYILPLIYLFVNVIMITKYMKVLREKGCSLPIFCVKTNRCERKAAFYCKWKRNIWKSHKANFDVVCWILFFV